MVTALNNQQALAEITNPDTIGRDLAAFMPIDLRELGESNLQDRIDTKYLFSSTELPLLLEELRACYRLLQINGARIHGYQTLYFDTPDFRLYDAHQVDRTDRFKVRSRRYVETQQSFLEIKHKNRKGRTVKNRIPTGSLLTGLDEEASAFISAHLPFECQLEPKLWNRFSRITLLSTASAERLTIDLDITFGVERLTETFPGVVVAEVKQATFDRGSAFVQHMRRRGIHPMSFSKYCAGAAVLNEELRHNRFKPALLQAHRLAERYVHR